MWKSFPLFSLFWFCIWGLKMDFPVHMLLGICLQASVASSFYDDDLPALSLWENWSLQFLSWVAAVILLLFTTKHSFSKSEEQCVWTSVRVAAEMQQHGTGTTVDKEMAALSTQDTSLKFWTTDVIFRKRIVGVSSKTTDQTSFHLFLH